MMLAAWWKMLVAQAFGAATAFLTVLPAKSAWLHVIGWSIGALILLAIFATFDFLRNHIRWVT